LIDAERQLLAAAGSADITPGAPACLGGFAGRTAPFRDVHDPLEVNAVALRQGGATAVLVACDLLFVGDELRRGVLARLEGMLEPDQLFMAASHTHFAPMTQRGMPLLGAVDDGYLARCVDAISGCVQVLLGRLAPARLSLRRQPGPPGWAINRRLKRLRLWTHGLSRYAGPAPNPKGPVDPTIRAIRLEDGEGRVVAVLWSYACHPTAFPDPTRVSAEYPGRVRASLRSHLRLALPVLFFQGLAGDVRPPFRRRIRTPLDVARRVLQGPGFERPDADQYREWVDSMAEAVRGAVEAEGAAPLAPDLACGRSSMNLAEVARGPATGSKTVTAHCIRLSREATLVGLGAEPLVGLRAVLERCVPPQALVSIGYIDNVDTYLPSDGDLAGGGYEVFGFRDAFAMDGRFVGGIDAAVERLVRRAMPPA
jgi:hypothetical protein